MTDDSPSTRLADGDGLEVADPADFKVSRGSDGELTTVRQRIPGTEKAVEVVPLHDGAAEEYDDVLSGGGSADDERVDELFQEHIVRGPGQDGIGGLMDYVVPALIRALKNSSGHDLFLAAQRQENEEMNQYMDLIDTVGVEKMEQLAEMDIEGGEMPQP